MLGKPEFLQKRTPGFRTAGEVFFFRQKRSGWSSFFFFLEKGAGLGHYPLSVVCRGICEQTMLANPLATVAYHDNLSALAPKQKNSAYYQALQLKNGCWTPRNQRLAEVTSTQFPRTMSLILSVGFFVVTGRLVTLGSFSLIFVGLSGPADIPTGGGLNGCGPHSLASSVLGRAVYSNGRPSYLVTIQDWPPAWCN